jgi:hypothetical protein
VKQVIPTGSTGTEIWVNRTRLFWIKDGSYVSAPKEGGDIATLAPAARFGWAMTTATDTDFYWTDYVYGSGGPGTTTLYSVPIEGGATSTVAVAATGSDVSALFADGDSLYWTVPRAYSFNGDYVGGHLVKRPQAGGAAVTLYQGSSDSTVSGGMVRGPNIYLRADDALLSVPTNGGAAVSLANLSQYDLWSTDDTAVFGMTGTLIVRAPFDGSTPTTVATGAGLQFFITGGNLLYWSENLNSTIWAYRMSGGNPQPLTMERGSATAMTADEDHVYWVNTQNVIESAYAP